jgi:cyclopropane-fatty-acyl-phospholipid synthase
MVETRTVSCPSGEAAGHGESANMKSSSLNIRIAPGVTSKPRFLDQLARRAVLARLRQLRRGRLTLAEGDETMHFGQPTAECSLDVAVEVLDGRFYSGIAFGGSIGAGEAYMQGYWSTNDLTGLVRLLVLNRDVLDGMETGLARLTAPAQKLLHWFNRNTQHGSKRNIAAHYDLGNDFFKLFLDETMMYSSAIFEHPDMRLHEAQIARLERICYKLDLKPTDHLLEIGTGWGGLALHAAKRFGCRITTTTISREQHALAVERIRAAGLSDRISVLLSDYRDLTGRYDKLVSIEMIEAVGHQYYDTYFGKCGALLKPDGMMLLQAITIADQHYEQAKRSVDFIQRYIFPGSCIPSVAAMTESIARASDLRLFHLEDIGPHYATTLRKWRENLFGNIAAVRALGYPESFIRMWEFYLCYCEGGFAERAIGDVHMLLVKPDNRQAPVTPPLI